MVGRADRHDGRSQLKLSSQLEVTFFGWGIMLIPLVGVVSAFEESATGADPPVAANPLVIP